MSPVEARSAGTLQNKLLRLLPPEELSVLLESAEKAELRPRQVLQHWKLPMEYIYFLESGLVSVAARVGNENFVEVWLIGSDGCVGVPLMLGTQIAPLHRRIVQVGGTALRIAAPAFREMLQRLPVLHTLLNRYVAFLLVQTSQCGACNLRHPLKQRLARWLLLARRSLNAGEIPLTHEVIGQLLGVRRASVTERLEELEAEGVISTRRRFIQIERVQELERMSCDCFGLIDREYHRQLDPGSCWTNASSAEDHKRAHHHPIWP
ncbi:Crp/Fnr family transcriptional regulator [Bradyrhizobium sp. ARR65]|uniref:Crp/Fnr family transcriptional regulator n=1 Tax=Bradyrhizobium sp. ARR65 TaxID=1040989 RepID=UPI0018DDA203|nr:Crp/Fnr family transcriptional regulator [Bradyrhizobium sp. ARR65]